MFVKVLQLCLDSLLETDCRLLHRSTQNQISRYRFEALRELDFTTSSLWFATLSYTCLDYVVEALRNLFLSWSSIRDSFITAKKDGYYQNTSHGARASLDQVSKSFDSRRPYLAFGAHHYCQ